MNKIKSRKMIKNNKNNKTKTCGGGKSKIGGLGTFFPRPPKNKEEELNTLAKDIGRVKLQRLEKSLKLEFDELRQLRKNCFSGCEIESCMYNNKKNCDYFKKGDKNMESYCANKFKNLHCRNYVSLYNKIQFYLNYINDVNQNCKQLFDDYVKENNTPVKI
jgi:uncharacterized protein with von Willebrand factor type A (vWA) domain